MYAISIRISCFICFLILFVSNLSLCDDDLNDDLRVHAGHMNNFGSSGPFNHVEIADSSISTKEFFDNYVQNKRPLLFKNYANSYPAFKLWTDEYLHKKASENAEILVTVETEKKESRSQEIKEMPFEKFIEIYKTREYYMVHEVPPYLKSDLPLHHVLQCGQASKTLEQTIMWYSSGGTKSVTHTDDYENILCLLDGRKDFTLIDSYKYEDVAQSIIDVAQGSYSSMDVEHVNYTNYPGLEDVEYFKANLVAGDCLFVPFRWIHQVNSFDRNIAINFWFNYEKIFNERDFPSECSNNKLILSNTLDKYNYTQETNENYNDFRYFILRQVNLGNRNVEQWRQVISKDLGVDDSLLQELGLMQLINEIFDILDYDGNGYLVDDELDLDINRLDLISQLFDDIYTTLRDEFSRETEDEETTEKPNVHSEL